MDQQVDETQGFTVFLIFITLHFLLCAHDLE